ncbi:MAG: D-glycero-beta-D-manno-heptose 1-phosphate adenylyltransferase [Chlorobi bacterium]|nr:D-glycero-beta-D-manno-heptose 1-phosphate adenylyltransferase [Chlorobiota bacterium]
MILEKGKLKEILDNLKSENKKIVFTNGCFDIIHSGHITYLYKAKSFGDVLIIGLNSDDSVRRLKGESRPINNQSDRAFVLSALRMIDYITIFNEDTPLELIKELKPNVLVKGGDYTIETIVGADFVKENGGDVRIVPLVKGKSTSEIINKIKK